MSVMDTTGSTFIDRFRSWAMARPEPDEVDGALAGLELYQPKDLPEMIEILREVERVCMAAQNEVHMRGVDEQRQRVNQLHLKGELPRRRPISIEEELRECVQSEFIGRWTRRALFLGEVRRLLEEELQSQETAGGSD